MTEPAPIQLRESGVGVVVGGLLLVFTTWLAPPALGATATAVIGVGYMLVGPDVVDPRRLGAGIALVGGIGMIETSRFGVGFEPIVIGTFAMAFGMSDILIGLIIGRMRNRRNEES